MSTLMMPAATMTTMTNTAPIAVTQPGKAGGVPPPGQAAPAGVVAGSNGQPGGAVAAVAADPAAVKMGLIAANNNCNKSQQGKKISRNKRL